MKIKLKNNVRTTMTSRQITMWKDLSQRLTKKQGYKISRTSLARKIEQESPSYPMTLIEALCNEFQCLPNDLFDIELSGVTPEEFQRLRRRERPFEFGQIIMAEDTPAESSDSVRAEASTETVDDDLIGGPVTHLDIAKIRQKKDQ